MGHGSRHSKNAGVMNSEAMTYAEIKALGYGTAYERLGKDSIGNFADCQLTLQPANDPVCTPWGIIYSKEALLENFVYQKKEIKRILNAWDEFETKESAEWEERRELEINTKLAEFEQLDQIGMSNPTSKEDLEKILEKTKETKNKIVVSGRAKYGGFSKRIEEINVFWAPSNKTQLVSTNPILHAKCRAFTKCPVTGKKLRLGDIVPLKFTKIPSNKNDEESISTYIDPISKDVLTNRSCLVCIRQTGEVMLHKTFKKLVEPEGIYHDTDVIILQSGGTGYVAHDRNAIMASKHTFLGIGSGMTDLRGQHSGASAKSGLVLS